MGPRVEAFERAFAELLGCRHCLAVSSGTGALHLAYLAAGVGPGDEVILPAFGLAGAAAAACYCGATPVFADIIGQDDLGIDPDDAAARVTPRTKIVVAAHFAGYAAPVDRLAELCEGRGLALVEDAGHAPGAALKGRRLGTYGRAGAFSFFGDRLLAAGEGGLLATDSDDVARGARLHRSHGMTSGTWARHTQKTDSYDIVDLGYNYRIDEPRAALLHSQLARLEDAIRDRRELTRRYRDRLAGVPGVGLPYGAESVAESACYLFPIMAQDPDAGMDLRRGLLERGVHTGLCYPAVHESSAYRERFGVELPRAELAARTQVSLPLFPHMTEEEQDRVVSAIETVQTS
jgi:dTDP-4-amino-4,6-dideoxygalactose transaminase